MSLDESSLSAAWAWDLISRRQQVSPKWLDPPGPSPEQAMALWNAAAQAPDHGLILPWRFVHITDPGRVRLGAAFEQALLERDPQARPAQRQEAGAKAYRAPFLALAVARSGRDMHPEIPLAERIASLGCALQNLLLMAQAQGFGAGLVSGQAMNSTALRTLFQLGNYEQAVCFVAVGTVRKSKAKRLRPSPSQFVTCL